jgi:hypothetical protein
MAVARVGSEGEDSYFGVKHGKVFPERAAARFFFGLKYWTSGV